MNSIIRRAPFATSLPPTILFRAADPALSQIRQPPLSPFKSTKPPAPERNLILLFGWMRSQDAHLEKYRAFWTARGFDTLTIRTPFIELFYPKSYSVLNATAIAAFLANQSPPYRSVVCHSFSIGTLSTFTFLQELCKLDSAKSKAIAQSLVGLILDSPNYPSFLPTGNARMLSNYRIIQFIIKYFFTLYYLITYPITWRRFRAIEALQAENPFRLPALFLYSANDTLMPGHFTDSLIESWKSSGIPVTSKKWPNSAHVMHFKNYPKEYSAEIDNWLKGKGLPNLCKEE